ncbi:hypothetical protein IW261DRAFT_1443862 [Armillaria novae-zelandiae]|uniref:RING-type domain-containing protein n=1 Tax=Armillaria novae-zelandiae TaxID=153914 RepID=A0AA39UH73_9AGAR|nr:hypothetical protein IW261DRAFT_1443862 [Armillaria novae-zelandiae]
MATQCPICLSSLTDPVCPPCGHIFCSSCLRRAVMQVTNGFQAPCPCCRKVFHIAIPDNRYLPPQFRPFVVDHIRSVYISTDDSQDLQDTRQLNESLERENRQLRERIRELEADGASYHGSDESEDALDAPILLPSFAGTNSDPVISSNLSNSMNIAGDSAHPRRSSSFGPETQFIHPPNTIHTGPARLLAPGSAMEPNRPNSSQTIVGMFAFTRPETRATTSARPGAVSMSSTMGNGASTSVFTDLFSRPESQHSIPSHQWGSGLPSTALPSFVNIGGVSLSGLNNAGQWAIPLNHALNMPNHPILAPQLLNSARIRRSYARRESQHRMATPAPAGQGPSAMGFTMVDVPAPSPSSGTESRRPS